MSPLRLGRAHEQQWVDEQIEATAEIPSVDAFQQKFGLDPQRAKKRLAGILR